PPPPPRRPEPPFSGEMFPPLRPSRSVPHPPPPPCVIAPIASHDDRASRIERQGDQGEHRAQAIGRHEQSTRRQPPPPARAVRPLQHRPDRRRRAWNTPALTLRTSGQSHYPPHA